MSNVYIDNSNDTAETEFDAHNDLFVLNDLRLEVIKLIHSLNDLRARGALANPTIPRLNYCGENIRAHDVKFSPSGKFDPKRFDTLKSAEELLELVIVPMIEAHREHALHAIGDTPTMRGRGNAS